MSSLSRSATASLRARVQDALDRWPEDSARRELVTLVSRGDRDHQDAVAYALARCGRGRRDSSLEFLETYERDRRYAVRTTVLHARAYLHDENPRAFVREMERTASLPGKKPWVPIMEELYWMWSQAPREMFRLMPPWLTHRNPWRRWAALHGVEVPARSDPRAALKVLRFYRGERDRRVLRLLGHVLGQGLYPWHPDEALEEISRWLEDGARASVPVSRQIEKQVESWFDSGMGSERQRHRLRRAAREYQDGDDPRIRAHARRLQRILAD